ncbi:MAG: VOC family protein [Paracoccus sp. (in: a-proteobacteria)]|nr:VOC family protein [Paracoccus sp. (in: a-proteobacteria)]
MNIDYVELYSPDLEATQDFMTRAFGWGFIEYGPDYREIQGAEVGGGIERAALAAPLIILKTADLQAAYDRITAAGATITREIFGFPGGRRFQFREPGGTEMAVWTPD